METKRFEPRLPEVCAIALLAIAIGIFTAAAAAGSQPSRDSVAGDHTRHRAAADRTLALEAHLLANPGDEASWQELLELLEGSAARDEFLAHYARRRDWAPQPDLGRDLEARELNQRLAWTSAAVAALPSNVDFRLALADLMSSGGDPLPAVAELAEELADDPRATYCLALGLAEGGEDEPARKLLEDFVEEHPDDPRASQALAVFLARQEQEEALLSLLVERLSRFPDDPRTRIGLLEAAAEFDPDGLARWLELAEASAQSVAERAALCRTLTEEDFDPLEGRCFRRLWRHLESLLSGGDGGSLPQDSVRYLLRLALAQGELRLALDLAELLEGPSAAEGWQQLIAGWDEELLDEPCAALAGAAADGRLDAAFSSPDGAATEDGLAAVQAAETCGVTWLEEAAWRSTLPRLDAESLAWRASEHEEARIELRRRFAAPSEHLDLLRLLASSGHLLEQLPGVGREQVLRRLVEGSGEIPPVLELASLLESEGRFGESEAVLGEVLGHHPEDPRLLLAFAGAALHAGHDTWAEEAARSLLRLPGATPREAATAGYVLGRAALRAGRAEEAAEHLEGYFLSFFEFAGCCDRGMDAALAALLRQLGPAERLAGYFEAKEKALAAFARAADTGPYAVCARRTCALYEDPSPAKTDVFKKLAKMNPGSRELQQKVADFEALENRWLNDDPERLFEDDRILAFDPASLGIARTTTIRCGASLEWIDEPAELGERFDPHGPGCPWH